VVTPAQAASQAFPKVWPSAVQTGSKIIGQTHSDLVVVSAPSQAALDALTPAHEAKHELENCFPSAEQTGSKTIGHMHPFSAGLTGDFLTGKVNFFPHSFNASAAIPLHCASHALENFRPDWVQTGL
jgi:hypothetical protein